MELVQPPAQEARDGAPHQVVAGILRFADLALLCHRAPHRRWYPDVWDLPGGHLEPGERPLQALRRELREELGIDIDTVSSEPVARIDGAGFELSVYVVNTWEGSARNCCEEEHDTIRWFAPTMLDDLAFAHQELPLLLRDLPSGRVK